MDLDSLLKLHNIKETPGWSDLEPGWSDLANQMFKELITANWDKDLQQIKEKFGQLRVYLGSEATDEHFKIVSKFEEMSATVCQACGNPGTLEKNNGWWSTFCVEHKQK
jgi:hypothetical protein